MDLPEKTTFLTNKLVSKVSIDFINSDAINGYGVKKIVAVTIRIMNYRCNLCGRFGLETPVPEQVMPPQRACHQWRNEWMVVSEVVGENLPDIWKETELKVIAFTDKYKISLD